MINDFEPKSGISAQELDNVQIMIFYESLLGLSGPLFSNVECESGISLLN